MCMLSAMTTNYARTQKLSFDAAVLDKEQR